MANPQQGGRGSQPPEPQNNGKGGQGASKTREQGRQSDGNANEQSKSR